MLLGLGLLQPDRTFLKARSRPPPFEALFFGLDTWIFHFEAKVHFINSKMVFK